MLHQSRRHISFFRARKLRSNMSVCEEILWSSLRKRPGGFKFRRQVPIDCYIVDFLCVKLKLVIEVDGFSHETQKSYDAQRTRWLEKLGYRVIRVNNEEVLQDLERVCAKILAACD